MINKEYEDIVKAAVAGGEVLQNYFGKILDVTEKTRPADVRTEADLGSEKAILKILSEKFPTYNIFAEESGVVNNNSEYTFVIDPLDGTNNFVLGIPYFSVGIGLMKGNETIFGVIYDPILKNLYFAEKGGGAYLNNERIFVNKEEYIKNVSLSVVAEYGDGELVGKTISNLYKKDIKRILTNWSVLLDFCLLASGKIEMVLVVAKIALYDFIPGKLIAKEAGAVVTDLKGNNEENDKNNIFLSSNGTRIHKEILEILNK